MKPREMFGIMRHVKKLGLTDEEIVQMCSLIKEGVGPGRAARIVHLERLFRGLEAARNGWQD